MISATDPFNDKQLWQKPFLQPWTHDLIRLLLFSIGLLLCSAINAQSSQNLSSGPVAKPAIETVRAASEYGYPPFCVVTQDGRADGFSVELLRAALQATHREVTFKIGPWSEVKEELADGRVQVLPLVGRTPEREAVYDFTFPYLTLHGTILVREGETGIRSLNDLQGKQVAVMAGDNAEEFLRRNNLNAAIVATKTFEDALRELAQGRHDAVVIQKLLALQLMKKLALVNLKTAGPPLEEFRQVFCFAVQEGDHQLLSLLNEGLALVIADGTFNRLQAKWFGPIEDPNQGRRRIVVGGDSDYPPYEYLDEFGKPTGYNVDLTRAIAKQMGIEVEIRLGPWGEIRRGLAEGEIDIIQGMFYSTEREAVYDFSPVHSVVNHVAVTRNGSQMPRSLTELGGRSVAVMDGDIMHDLAVKQGHAKQLILAKSQEEALRLVSAGKAELALVAKLPALYWIKTHRLHNLQMMDRSFLSPDYCYAAPHGNDRLVSLFSEGLANIKGTGQYRKIYAKWLGVYEAPRIDWRDILKYSLFTTVPVLLLLAGFVLWSRTLRRQVELRTAELRNEVAERQQRELEIRAKNAELDQKNAELERFTYTVSHDLKSPLVTLKSFLGFVEKDLKAGDQDRLKKDVHFMHGAIDKMNHLLIDLLQLSQIGRVVAPSQPIAFRELVAEALSLVSGSLTEPGLTIEVADDSLLLFGDRTRLTEIWQNLIDNAIKYRRPEAASMIQIGVTPSDDGPVFFVRDNGLGIDPRFQDKIFGLFNQLDPRAEGSGVGLALVARIVELYEGKIWVESQGLGHGTCFHFTLPRALRNPAEDI